MMTEKYMGPLNATVASAAMSSPLWVMLLEGLSWAAQITLPILGVILAGLQIYVYWSKHKRDKDK